jgi:thiol-disulfide isomerase/thioredoxin
LRRALFLVTAIAFAALDVACGEARAPTEAKSPPLSKSNDAPPKPKVPSNAVYGSVLDHAGQPLSEAWVRLIGASGGVEVEVKVDPRGSFLCAIDGDTQRVRRLDIAGAGHKSHTILVAMESLPVDVIVKLGTYSGAAEIVEAIELRLSPYPEMWTFAKSLTKGDGTYDAEVQLPDGKYPFEILGKASAYRRLADGYATVTSHKTRIAFDLARRPPSDVTPVVAFADAKGPSVGLTEIWTELAQAQSAYAATVAGALNSGKPAASVTRTYSWSEEHEVLAKYAHTHRHEVVRNAAGVAYFAEGRFAAPTSDEVDMAKTLLARVEPSDALWWIVGRRAFANVAAVAGETLDGAYARRFVATQPDVDAVVQYLVAEGASAKDDPTRARAVVALLRQPRFSENLTAKHAQHQLDPDSVIAVGKPAPSFDVRALGADGLAPHKRYTPRSFAKKLLLLDVWATWCKPCVAEMAQLHELYAKYGAKAGGRSSPLAILSVSIDGDAGKVVAFRKDETHTMPWDNAVVDEGETKALFHALGFEPDARQVPFYVLVDERGLVLRASPQLNGETLAATIEKALASHTTPR